MKFGLFVVCTALCFGSVQRVEADDSQPLVITSILIDKGFNRTRRVPVDTIVIHSSFNPGRGEPYSVADVIDVYRRHGVSAHYLIDRSGKVYRLVPEAYISFHAGKSAMSDGRTGVNQFSIGIELLNKTDDTYTKEQYHSLRELIISVKRRHVIKYIVGHGEIAQSRRSDPWNFDWKMIDDL